MARPTTAPARADRGSALYVATALTGLAGRLALAEQRRRIRAYLRVQGWRARHHAFFQDGDTRTAPRWRPGVQALLAAAPRGEFSRVTALGAALSDDPLICASIAQELAGFGVDLSLVPEAFEESAALSVPPRRASRPRPLLTRLHSIVRRVEAAVEENRRLRAEQAELTSQLADLRRRAGAVAGLVGASAAAAGGGTPAHTPTRPGGRPRRAVRRRRRPTEA